MSEYFKHMAEKDDPTLAAIKRPSPSCIQIESVHPNVDGGRYPAKAIIGEVCVVEADIFCNRRDVIRAAIKWRPKDVNVVNESPMEPLENDLWRGQFPVTSLGRYIFTVEAWIDPFSTWLNDFREKIHAHQATENDLQEGLLIIEPVISKGSVLDQDLINGVLKEIKANNLSLELALTIFSQKPFMETIQRIQPHKEIARHQPALEVNVLPKRGRTGSWYELFVRSQGKQEGVSGTFLDAEARLADIKNMGFDVVYLAPIHPIGVSHRKGRDGALEAKAEDPGCPWAIGNEKGGHIAIEPELGTFEDFDRFVARANDVGLELAMDFAIQCSPDHPWVKEHPNWFYQRPDGSIKYAENPPMKYEDIYPLNFESTEWPSLWEACKDVVLFWVRRGVKIFRVDNPHTKPLAFWKWLIEEVTKLHSDVIFLGEAFTRPKMMKALSKVGFTQSYTYFIWRNNKQELIEYINELTRTDMKNYFLPNFFITTHDVLPHILQVGGRPAFKMRLALAATSAPSYGIYSGYEILENEALPGTEEYGKTEKFEFKVRDWNKSGHIKDYISLVNKARAENPALQHLTNIEFLDTPNDKMIAYVKRTNDFSNVVIVIINLDPFAPQEGTVSIPGYKIGLPDGQGYQVTDLITGQSFNWSNQNFVRLDPQIEPAHILKVHR